MRHPITVEAMELRGLGALGEGSEAGAEASNPVWDALLSIPGIVQIKNDTFYSNPLKMRVLFAETTGYPAVTNYGDFRWDPGPAKIDQWIKEAEREISKNAKGPNKNQSLVDIIMDPENKVPEMIKDMVRAIQRGWPDRMVYSKAQNFPVDSTKWLENEAISRAAADLASAAIQALGSLFGVNLDLQSLFRALVSAVIFLGDYVRENYKAWREAGFRKASKDRRDKVIAAYKANFNGLKPSMVTQKAWGTYSDPYALPDGTTKAYLDAKAAYDKEVATIAKLQSFANLSGKAEKDARVGVWLMLNIAEGFNDEDAKTILRALEKGTYNGNTKFVTQVYTLPARPVNSDNKQLLREHEVTGANDYYAPMWEDTRAGNFNWRSRNRGARERAAQLAFDAFSFWDKEKRPEGPVNCKRFDKYNGSMNASEVARNCIQPVLGPMYKAAVEWMGGDDKAWPHILNVLRKLSSHTGGGQPGEPMAKLANFLALHRWEPPVAPKKNAPSRCPGGGTACLPGKAIVGRLPVGAKQLPDLPKSPKSMTEAERKAFVAKLQQVGYPDYYIEAILLNPSDWYEGVPSGSGLAGLGEDAPFYKQTWYWLAVAGVVGGYLYYRKR